MLYGPATNKNSETIILKKPEILLQSYYLISDIPTD
jgi:hypothetical protein